MIAHAKQTLGKIGTVVGVIFKRLLPVATFFILFVIVASMIDRKITEDRPATDYLRYYSFDVQNAREGEDVQFRVCRSRDSNFNYNGRLSVYVVPDATQPNKDAQVFGKDIGGTLRPGDCENKVLRASEFKHAPGKYKMFISVSFREPRYNFEKTTTFTSNIYTVYAQPTDLEGRIQFLQQQLDQANEMLREAQTGQPAVGDDLRAPTGQAPQTQPQSVTVQPNQQSPSQTTPAQTQPQTREVCTINLLGIRINCRQEPV